MSDSSGDAKIHLRLYVTDHNPRSLAAIENLQRICDEHSQEFELEVIDVLEEPDLAEEGKIVATPTLIRQLPDRVRRVIGDLADTKKVLVGLALLEAPSSTDPVRDDT